MTTTRYDKGFPCPDCGHYLDAATGEEGAKPKTGDFSICINCATVMRFTTPPEMEKVTEAELNALPAEDAAGIAEARKSILEIVSAKNVGDLFMKHFGRA
jgi:hypothetical protein